MLTRRNLPPSARPTERVPRSVSASKSVDSPHQFIRCTIRCSARPLLPLICGGIGGAHDSISEFSNNSILS